MEPLGYLDVTYDGPYGLVFSWIVLQAVMVVDALHGTVPFPEPKAEGITRTLLKNHKLFLLDSEMGWSLIRAGVATLSLSLSLSISIS